MDWGIKGLFDEKSLARAQQVLTESPDNQTAREHIFQALTLTAMLMPENIHQTESLVKCIAETLAVLIQKSENPDEIASFFQDVLSLLRLGFSFSLPHTLQAVLERKWREFPTDPHLSRLEHIILQANGVPRGIYLSLCSQHPEVPQHSVLGLVKGHFPHSLEELIHQQSGQNITEMSSSGELLIHQISFDSTPCLIRAHQDYSSVPYHLFLPFSQPAGIEDALFVIHESEHLKQHLQSTTSGRSHTQPSVYQQERNALLAEKRWLMSLPGTERQRGWREFIWKRNNFLQPFLRLQAERQEIHKLPHDCSWSHISDTLREQPSNRFLLLDSVYATATFEILRDATAHVH